MTLLALRALLARVPMVAWLVLGFGLLALAIWITGERRGERMVRREAIRDSVHVQAAHVDTAAHHTDVAVRQAVAARDESDFQRHSVRALRLRAQDSLAFAPPLVQQLVAIQSETITRDSVTIATAFAALDSAAMERVQRLELDTLHQHEVAVGASDAPPRHTGRVVAVSVAAGAGLVYLLLHH